MAEMRIGIVGCAGRMGQTLARLVWESEGFALAGGTEGAGHPALGRDLGEIAGLGPAGLSVGGDPAALFEASEAVLDFTSPEATAAHAGIAAETSTILVIGTTGLGSGEDARVAEAGKRTAIVHVPNMSVCVNLMIALSEQVAARLDEDYDVEVVELHHRGKVDAPSGTALALGRAVAAGRGVDLEARSARARDGFTGPRRRGDIGFAVLRGGDAVGEHTVIFAADGERLELTHRCTSRVTFARGALRAAAWARGKGPGVYGMADVLGLIGPSG